MRGLLFWGLMTFATLGFPATYQCTVDGVPQFQDRPCAQGALVGDTMPDAKPGAKPDTKGESSPAPAEITTPETAATADGHLLWVAEGRHGRVYLLGSIHFGKPEMYPLPPLFEKSLANSDALIVEADLEAVDPLQMATIVREKGMYTDGSTLKAHITAETWRALESGMHKIGAPIVTIEQQKPWLASMTLTALLLKKVGYREELGIDGYFIQQARKSGKPIIELEGLSYQLSLFDQFTQAEQEEMLKESLRELDEGEAFFNRMLTAWSKGDDQALAAMFEEGFMQTEAGRKVNEIIMYKRNQSMAEKIDNLLKGDRKTAMVVIGAGHLVGEQSVLAHMRQKGYAVKKVTDGYQF